MSIETTSPATDQLVRPLQPMPDFVRLALEERGLVERYAERPAYQRNDYLMWINKAAREETQLKRLNQMLDELEAGGVYMRMKWSGGR
ncbi:YdeI/OmpD-associated family protein [Paradevosia shaoguanensis]|uniref:YdeI/OmpD-associated family protein n=1 Tax=Paradevosia shaoguanensis TaxID=1335043 RepID=UPI00068DEAF2